MKTLGLDVDAVLAETHGSFLETYNQEHGTNYSLSDISYWDWPIEEFGRERFIELTNQEWREFEDISPCEDNIGEVVDELSEEFDIHIVTARSGCDNYIQNWLQLNQVTAFETFNSGVSEKSSLGLEFYIDDNPNMVDKMTDSQKLFLKNRHWNQNLDSENFIRIDSILDCLEYV